MDSSIHIDRKTLTKAQRWVIADRLAEDRLPVVNENSQSVKPSTTFYAKHGKRALDIIISGAAIAITLPINAACAVVTAIDVGKPIFFRQKRVGKDVRLFDLVKFRNMRNDVDERGELLPADQRVTKFGSFMRKTSFDELLNFYSVFRGDMSIIGPRPLVPEYIHRYSDRHLMRLAVRPGLECPPRKLDGHVWSWTEQFENDVWYVENLSFKTDCIMFANLVRFALDRKSAQARATAARGTFMGYSLDGDVITLEEVPQEYIDRYGVEN